MDSEDDSRPFANPWQAENGLSDPAADAIGHSGFAHPYLLPENPYIWNPPYHVDSSGMLTNLSMVSAPSFESAPSSYTHNGVANDMNLSGYHDAYKPRGSMAIDQVRDLINTASQPACSNIESQHLVNTSLAEIDQEEPEYVTNATISHATKRTRKTSFVSPEEWQRLKPEIERLYVYEGRTLKETRDKMAEMGFHAESVTLFSFLGKYFSNLVFVYRESMYKRKIKQWKWTTYERVQDFGNSGGELSIREPASRTRGKALSSSSMLHERTFQSDSSRSTTVASCTPPPLAHNRPQSAYSEYTLVNNTHGTSSHFHPSQSTSTLTNASALLERTWQFNSSGGTSATGLAGFGLPYTNFSNGIPLAVSDIELNGLLGIIINEVKHLYISYPAQDKWKIKKQREVEEDEHDDLLVGVGASLRNYSQLSATVGYTGFQNALHTLEKVVGVGEGRDCGLFSLPAICESFLRIVRAKRLDWAREFLSQALILARKRFPHRHPFVQVLYNLPKIWMKNPHHIEEIVCQIYRSCIVTVKDELGAFNLTHLQLWGDYVVYLDGRSIDETQAVVKNIRSVIKISDEEKGPDGGTDGDYSITLLGLTLYILQSSQTMVVEAEKVAKELLVRLDQRKERDGGKLDGTLFVTWKDLIHTLGTLSYDKKEYHQAIGYLEVFCSYEIADERDTLALETLQSCYLSLGRDFESQEIRQQRLEHSQRLLEKREIRNETELVGREKDVNDYEELYDGDGRDTIEEGGSEETVVDWVEEINEDSLEEKIADISGDREVEIQLLQEQIAELEQRLEILKGARGDGEIF